MKNIYHATPYDIHATGFYFSTYEDYMEQAVSHKNEFGDPVEEYEIQFIDGDNYKLFEAIGVNQANLKQWFDDFEDMATEDAVKVIYLLKHIGGYSFDKILRHIEDMALFEGTALEYAEQYIEETGVLDFLDDYLHCYFDVEAYARDLVLSGDISEVEIDGTNYIVWGC